MKSPLEKVVELESLISTLQKIDSLMDCGRFIYANRILHKVMADLESVKKEIVAESKGTVS